MDAYGSGHVQVHVSGLPAECVDTEVDATLRRIVSGTQPAQAASQPTAGVAAERGSTNAEAEVEASLEAARTEPEQQEEQTDRVAEQEDAVGSSMSSAVLKAAEDGSGDRRPAADEAEAEAAVGLVGVEANEVEEAAQEDAVDEATAIENEMKELAAFVSCAVVRSKDTLECKGYCFLTFENLAKAEAALELLNAEVPVNVCGREVQAQLSRPKERRGGASAQKEEHMSDLRLRRALYQAVSKKAQYGHFDATAQKLADEAKGGSCARNSAGRKVGITGTRGGYQLKDTQRQEDAFKRNSGFDHTTRAHK
jgi:hypothetical protein